MTNSTATITRPSAATPSVAKPSPATTDLDKLTEGELVDRIKGELVEIQQAESSAKRTVVRHALILESPGVANMESGPSGLRTTSCSLKRPPSVI